MKFKIRIPSLKKKIAARTSAKRAVHKVTRKATAGCLSAVLLAGAILAIMLSGQVFGAEEKPKPPQAPKTIASVDAFVALIPKEKLPPAGGGGQLERKVLNDWMAANLVGKQIKMPAAVNGTTVEGEKVRIQCISTSKTKKPVEWTVDHVFEASADNAAAIAKVAAKKNVTVIGTIKSAVVSGGSISVTFTLENATIE